MCGIAAIVGTEAGRRVEQLITRLRHRGPDARGGFTEPEDRVALGHARLAIVDLAGGNQPLSNEDGTVVVVANGQIYNDRELRQRLEANGHTFATGSDCEVIVHLYEEHGDDLVHHLDGMFAFALWDRPRRRLLVARDRLGIKPLAYAPTPGGLCVASEVRAIAADPAVDTRLDEEAIAEYLTWGFIPAPLSIYRGIRKLPPGTRMVIDADDPTTPPRPERYWEPPRAATKSPSQPVQTAEELLVRSVAERLRADVPVGIFLSGGLDSSLIAHAAVRAGARPPAFCLGFAGVGDESWDERPRARLVAAHLGLPLHEVVVRPEEIARASELAALVDEPFADSSALLVDRLVVGARQHVKVALSGEGGDELFAGYPRHRGMRLAQRMATLPTPLRALLGACARPLRTFARNPPAKASAWHHAARFLDALAPEADTQLLRWGMVFAPAVLDQLAPGLSADSPSARALELLERGDANDAVARALRFDLVRYLPDDLLVKADRIGLGHALEIRTPFLDHHLVDEVAAWPSAVRLPGQRTKPILRDLAARVLPREVTEARKGGFSLPLDRWLREGRLPQLERDLAPERVREFCPFLDPETVQQLLAEHRGGRALHGARLHALAVLVAWLEQQA